MCGIAGFASTTDPVPHGGRILRQFEQDLRHRGPDDQGRLLTADGRVGFAATRLAILDLSAAGHQPMRSADGLHMIVFNGEIYNFRDLRSDLAASGVAFQSNSDTEVVLQLYLRDGAACVDRLRGMFAFAIWSADDESCFLARDALGIKPLYYHLGEADGVLVFASELKALLRSGLVAKTLNARAVQAYFRTGSVAEPETLINGVRSLEAGFWTHWSGGKIVERKQYWQLKLGEQRPELCEVNMGNGCAAQIVRASLLDSIDKHFVSDVPVGLFLSGGIDSTAILALARATGRDNLRTFSVGVPDEGLDESGDAARTAQHFGTRHEAMRLDGRVARDLFERFLEQMDQPSVDGFNTFVVSQFARSFGMKVVLSGIGGDELFGGYPSLKRVPQMVEWSSRLDRVAPLRAGVGKLMSKYAPRTSLRRLGEFLTQQPRLSSAYSCFRGIFTFAEARALTYALTGAEPESGADDFLSSDYASPRDAVSALEITRYMRNQLLRDGDVMSMANGLEIRVPFVDRTLIDGVGQLPDPVRLQPGKRLLLDAVPEVPTWVATAPKRGFTFPFEQWIDHWSPPPSARRSGVRLDSWYQKWTVSIFESWLAQTF